MMLSSSSSTSASGEEEAPSAIRVLVRVRPLNDRESSKSKSVLQLQSGETTSIDFGIKAAAAAAASSSSGEESSSSASSAEGIVFIADQQQQGTSSFTYDAVFGPESKQTDIFESVKGIIDAVVGGYNGTIVAYGQTSSGKTHTIFGEDSTTDSEEAAGLVQRSLKAIFDKMSGNDESAGNSSSQRQCHSAKASFFEIYNEKVYDLLSSNDNMLQESLAVREDSSKGVYVEGLMEQEVTNTADAMDVLRVGNDNRRVAATSMNRVSSRSHAVFVLTVKNVITNDIDGLSSNTVLESKFTLVDLAGSERQKTTDTAGERLKEASMINNSLLCLGQVINSLVDREKGKERHVPFRDSKLTFLLRDSWGGNSKTCLVATVTPSVTSISETLSTLKFAQRAKLIKNAAVKNETYSVAALQMEIARLKSELEQRNCNGNASVVSAASSGTGSGTTNSIDRITISSLRNHNSTLNENVKVLQDQSNLMEQQVNSLKRMLQQETMIRKCRERRITYLSSKSRNDEGVENEEIANLQNEMNTLREQLESKQTPESIKWMMKYKEEKAKLELIQISNAAALYEATDKEKLEKHLDSLLNAKDALEQELASIQHGRHSKMDTMSKDVAKLEKEIVALKSQLSKKEAEHEADIKITKSQISSLDKDRIEALEFLETVNSELVAEQQKVAELQSSVDSMIQLVQEKENNVKDYQLKEAAQQYEVNGAKTQIQTLQKDLDTAKEENCSLIKNFNDARCDLSANEAEVAHLKSESEGALASFNLKEKEGIDKLESLQAQLTVKEEQLITLLHEKTELEDIIKNIAAQNASVLAEVEVLKKNRVGWQERVDSLEDEVVCISQEKKQVEEELNFVQEDLKRTFFLQEKCNVEITEAHDIDLTQRDETISLLRSEKESLQVKLDIFREQTEILQNEILSTKEDCQSVKKKEANLLSTLDALTDGYDQLRSEKDATEMELKETKKLLKNSTSMNAELERCSEAKLSEIEAAKEDCEALKKKEQQLLSDLETAKDISSQLQSEKSNLEEELVAANALLENSTFTNAELESSNKLKAVEVHTLRGEFEVAKQNEQQLLSELETVKSASSQLQLEKEAVEMYLTETKALLEISASTNKDLERSTAANASEMEASVEKLKNQVLRLSEEREAAKVFETQVDDLTEENQSHQATIEKLRSSLSESESAKIEFDKIAASKVNELEALLISIKDEHAAKIDEMEQVAESVKAEMLGKEESAAAEVKAMEELVGNIKNQHAEEIERLNNEAYALKIKGSDNEEIFAAKLKEMEELVAGIKEQQMKEIERLNNDAEALKTMATEKEESAAAKLKEAEELVSKLKDQHSVEIERMQKEGEVVETEAISKEEAIAKRLSETETVVASLKDQHADEIEQLKQEAELAKTEMLEKEENTFAKLKEMEAAVTSLKDQHAEEIEHLNRQAEALKSDVSDKEEIIAAKLSESEAATVSLKEEHASEIERLNQEAEAVKAEMMNKEGTSSVKLKEMEELVKKMMFQHADEIEKEKMNLKADALQKVETTNTKLEGDVLENNVNDTTFDADDDDDFDESMFLPNVDVQPVANEIETDPPASRVVDSQAPTDAPASPAVTDPVTAPPIVADKLDENRLLSPSMTPFKARREMFANQAKQNTADGKPSPKKPPTRRSNRATAKKTDQTPVPTRRSTRSSSSRTPFTDLQDTSSSSTRKVRTNFQGGAFD